MLRILVVDDDKNMRQLLALHLENAGYQVDVAENPFAAGHALIRARPDLIITDINMPGLDGFDFVAVLRQDNELRDIPVVFLSTEPPEQARAAGLKVERFISKPVRADTLLSIVASQVGGRVPIG